MQKKTSNAAESPILPDLSLPFVLPCFIRRYTALAGMMYCSIAKRLKYNNRPGLIMWACLAEIQLWVVLVSQSVLHHSFAPWLFKCPSVKVQYNVHLIFHSLPTPLKAHLLPNYRLQFFLIRLLNDTCGAETNKCRMAERQINYDELERILKEMVWPNQGSILQIACRDRSKRSKTLGRITGVPAQIRTEHIPNTCFRCFNSN